jgi:hypothetical protein
MSGLIVPVDVLAYCVGKWDAHNPAQSFAGSSTDYTRQALPGRLAYLGINVTRGPDDPPLWDLEQGVHLHWALPDALTRAVSADGRMAFPALPSRWLVTRVVGDAQQAKHWIVQSDVLSTTKPHGAPAPTVPVADTHAADAAHTAHTAHTANAANAAGREPGVAERGFRYLGTWEVFTPEWAEPRARAETLRDLTGAELHAVATGDIAFAAFYPDSRSVFGFHDDLADVTGQPANLMYVVTGWYDTPANDPLHAGLTVPELEARLGWTCPAPEDEAVTYSLYSGLVQGIEWDPATHYLADADEPVDADLAIGNHPAEALAAYFRGKLPAVPPPPPDVEDLLTLYLTGLLPQLATPSASQLAELKESLHELQFTGVDGGTGYTVMRGGDEVTNLPLPLADALNLLNTRQQAADTAAAQVGQAKWQLFAAWYRLFEVNQQTQDPAFRAFSSEHARQRAIAAWAQTAADAAAAQRDVVRGMLTDGLSLASIPASRYYTATEPVVLLAGDAAKLAERYGGDGRYHPAGYLACRLGSGVLRALGIGPSVTLEASQFAALTPAAPNNLPYPQVAALIEEAALLDAFIGAAASGIGEQTLADDLVVWLELGQSQYYGRAVGVAPSPVAVNEWRDGNPWMSLTLLWQARFHPLLDTSADGALADYPPGFFTENYRLDPDDPRLISYTAGGIDVDPEKIDFNPDIPDSGTVAYRGSSVLSTTAVRNLRGQLAKDPQDLDPTLADIAQLLAHTDIALQGLTGFNDALLTRQSALQLSIGVSPDANLALKRATTQTTAVITSLSQIPPLSPRFNGNYSGIRAGYLELSLRVMDPFGRKRKVRVGDVYIADSLATRVGDDVAPGITYLQPRVSQPSRLLFRWLAADTTEYDEMNPHPATTPVCGWLLPEHLTVGFLLYNGQGDPLGSLTLRADGTGIVWQSTPGDQATIDASLATVLADQNQHLRELALALGGGTPAAFRAFWQAADDAIPRIVPASPASSSGLAALVGRPLALVQASLLVQRQGLAALDQTFATLSGGQFADTDHQAGGVGFPVVLGDLERLDDGLVGYFKQAADGGYDTATFYSQAATGSDPAVVVPSPTNLLLGAQATPATAPDTAPLPTKLLMLVDPRAAVHATMGILPTQSLAIPPDQYAATLAGLELSFPVKPLLRAAGGLSVPLPAVAGYAWSWITEESTRLGTRWAVDPEPRPPTAGALWQYSPQTLTEGWLRLNPTLLRFQLAVPGGAPVVTAGTTMSLDLLITNARSAPVTFTPGAIEAEDSPAQGSVCYIHLGSLVDPEQVTSIRFAAAGWRFEPLTDVRYGTYWAVAPLDAPVTLAPGEPLTITMANVAIAAGTRAQSRVSFDYYNLAGLDDGIAVAVLAVRQPGPA